MYPVKSLVSKQKAVTAAGVAEALSATKLEVSKCKIKANKANTDLIFIGNSTVSSTTGYQLSAEDVISLEDILPDPNGKFDLNAVYIDSAVNGEGVSFLYCN